MAAFALSEYRFPGNTLLGLYLALGIMIPIRLGTVSLLRLIVGLQPGRTRCSALILVYIAQGLPLAIFILRQFMLQVPSELKQAARVDGASEYRIFWLVLPLVRPAIGAIGVFTMIPIWNDLWFPLIIAPGEQHGHRDAGRAAVPRPVCQRLERRAGLADPGDAADPGALPASSPGNCCAGSRRARSNRGSVETRTS